MNDHELRRLDIEVDYFDPTTASTQTLTLNDVNIGDTTSFDDPKFIAFGDSLYQVSEVRIDDLVGTSPTGRVVFREVQGMFATQTVEPEISIASSETGAIQNGASDIHGVETSGVAKTVTYTIANSGTSYLTLDGEPTLSNVENLRGPVALGPLTSASLAPGETASFDVTYTPNKAGAYGFNVALANNDYDDGNYAFAVAGTANDAPGVALTSSTNILDGTHTVTATFSEPVSGMDLSDFVVTNGVASGFSSALPGVFAIIVTPTDPSLPSDVIVPAGTVVDADGETNIASNALRLSAASVLMAAELADVEEILVTETVRDLRRDIVFNQKAVRGARARHADFLRCRSLENDEFDRLPFFGDQRDDCGSFSTRGTDPVFAGEVTATETGFSGSSEFFVERSNLDSTKRLLTYGELSFERSEDGDTASMLTGRMAWESLIGEDVLRGVFIGASVTQSDIEDSFSGTRNGYGVNAGVYFVDRLENNLFWDGFVSIGVGRNSFELENGTLDADGDYSTTTLQAGLAVSGERTFDRFELRPELSIAYGVTSVAGADVAFSDGGGASTYELSVSSVSLGVVRFRPEFVFPSNGGSADLDQNRFTAAPSVFCQTIRTSSVESDCGGGLEIGWSYLSDDGLGEFSAQASREMIGDFSSDRVMVGYDRRF